MPEPVSLTESSTYFPGGHEKRPWRYSRSRKALDVSIRSRPPSGMANRELTTRFISICSMWPRSTFTTPMSNASVVIKSTSSPRMRRNNFSSFLSPVLSQTVSLGLPFGDQRPKYVSCRGSGRQRNQVERVFPFRLRKTVFECLLGGSVPVGVVKLSIVHHAGDGHLVQNG